MKCTYCRKKIWFWQQVQPRDIDSNKPKFYHFPCLAHKLWSTLMDFAYMENPGKTSEEVINTLRQLIKAI
jgi:hypothetical protein